MLLLRRETLPQGPEWHYELKHDGYRAIAFKSDGRLHLRSRNNKDFSKQYPQLLKGLEELPDETVIDGEVVAFNESGRPSFNVLQNSATGKAELVYYVYDVMVLAGKDVMSEPLDKRRMMLEKKVLPKLKEPVRYSQNLDARLDDLISSVKATGLEGLVAKKGSSRYEPGIRSGAWAKDANPDRTRIRHRGLHAGGNHVRCARLWILRGNATVVCSTHSQWIHTRLKSSTLWKTAVAGNLGVSFCESTSDEKGPVGTRPDRREDEGVSLGEAGFSRAVQISEWTGDDHLRHSRFIGLREDKNPREVVRERHES